MDLSQLIIHTYVPVSPSRRLISASRIWRWASASFNRLFSSALLLIELIEAVLLLTRLRCSSASCIARTVTSMSITTTINIVKPELAFELHTQQYMSESKVCSNLL